MILRLKGYTGAADQWVGICARDVATDDKSVMISYQWAIGPTQIPLQNSILYRTTTNGGVTSLPHTEFVGQTRYFGYQRIERSGSNFFVYYSDDGISWSFLQSQTLNTNAFSWGIWVSSNVDTTFEFDELRFYGPAALGCSGSASHCKHDSPSSCVLPLERTFVECSENTWRSAYLLSTLLTKPLITITTTTISISSKTITILYPPSPLFVDELVTVFKQVNGDGSITIKIDSFTSGEETTNPSYEGAFAGVMFQASRTGGSQLTVSDIVQCFAPYKGNLGLLVRSGGVGSFSTTLLASDYSVGTPTQYWLRLSKVGTLFTCSYSTDGTSFSNYATATSTFVCSSGTCNVGISQNSNGTLISAQISNVYYRGFTGYCGDRGDCGINGGQLDQCVCLPAGGYIGKLCQTTSCNYFGQNDQQTCSGNGNCTAPNVCNCTSNYIGAQCATPLCFGLTGERACSSNGACVGVDTCNCNQNKFGPQCNIDICYGILGNNTNVCSTKGNCIGTDTCNCTTGYGANDCSASICYGLLSTDPQVCSGRGTCSGPNSCVCNTGFGLNNCSVPICYGRLSTDVNVCSRNGTCTAPDTCACLTGYGSNNCSQPLCYGLLSSNPSVCSGNGSCVSPNNCMCNTGYGSNDCSQPICFGLLSSNPAVCTGRGTCVSPNTCTCPVGYGSSNCSQPICSSRLATDPLACNGNGTCTAPDTCSCKPGYTGNNCQFPICFTKDSSDPTVCNGRGNCVLPDTCSCNPGYSGNQCQNTICFGFDTSQPSLVCSGNGTCSSPNNCNCKPKYAGNTCSLFDCYGILSNQTNVCSSKGRCIAPDSCLCNSSFTGNQCQLNTCAGLSETDPTVCLSRGTCIGTNNCQCNSGWIGSNCETFTCQDRNFCSQNGTCIGANDCQCNSRYTGSNCSIPICYGKSATDSTVCTGNGWCYSPDSCTCFSNGYSGNMCQNTVCAGRNNCSQNGVCVGANNCSCNAGWTGLNCDIFICPDVGNCSFPTKGSCSGPNTCTCTSLWSGPDCTAPTCGGVSSLLPTVCSSRGTCGSPNNCTCSTNYVGSTCQFPVCFGKNSTDPTVCSGAGTCTLANTCVCSPGKTGSQCELNICGGIPSNSSSVCSSRGTCSAPDNCVCNTGYTGWNCQLPICYGINQTNPLVCNGAIRGSCTDKDTCSCNSGYSGSQCQDNICFGISSANSNVCNFNGNCTAPNTCVCDTGYSGTNCSNSILWNYVNAQCTTGCLLNKLTWSNCIFNQKGINCYCNAGSSIQTSTTGITCNGASQITGIRLSFSGLSGPIQSLLAFNNLQTLDLSGNSISVSANFNTFLPISIRSFNLTRNSLSNQADFYEVQTSLTNFNNLLLDQNSICGIYPSTYLSGRGFTVSFTGHTRTIWCTSLNSICQPIQAQSSFVLLPHETSVPLIHNSVPSQCQFYLGMASSVLCRSSDQSSSLTFSHSGYNSGTRTYTCLKSSMLSTIDQTLSMVWAYNGTFREPITTQVSVVNLPLANLISLNTPLIYSNNSGFANLVINTNQNMTRYRKIPTDNVQCFITPGNLFYNATSIGGGSSVSCTIALTTPNLGPLSVSLYEASRSFIVSSNSLQYYLFNVIISPNIARIHRPQTFTLLNSLGTQINAINGFTYSLTNTTYGINYPCSVSGGFITTCTKNSDPALPTDIFQMNLNLNDGTNNLVTLSIIFYEQSPIRIVTPTVELTTASPVIFEIVFVNDVLLSSVPTSFYGMCGTSQKTITFFNRTTIRRTVSTSSTFTDTNCNIFGRVSGFSDFQISNTTFEYSMIKPNTIILASYSVFVLPSTITIQITTTESMLGQVRDDVFLRYDDLTTFSTTYLFNGEHRATITSSQLNQNVNAWIREPTNGKWLRISTNSIPFTFITIGTISYNSTSVQLGNTGITYQPRVTFSNPIPSSLQNNVTCSQKNSLVTTQSYSTSIYGCSVFSSTPDISNITLGLTLPTVYKVNGRKGVYRYRRDLRIVPYGPISTVGGTAIVLNNINTADMIAKGHLRSDCFDLVVITNDKNPLSESQHTDVSSCNTASSTIRFIPRRNDSSSTISYYSLVYGNPNHEAPPIVTISIPVAINDVLTTFTQLPDTITLNLTTNSLDFYFIQASTINTLDPLGALVPNSLITMTTNYPTYNYRGLISYEVRYASNKFAATQSGTTFTSTITGTPQNLTLSLWANYIPTGESVPASLNSMPFFFAQTVTMLHSTPFIGKYNPSSPSLSTTIIITLQTGLVTDSYLFCRTTFKGITSFTTATFVGINTRVSCQINLNALSSAVEIADIQLFYDVSPDQSKDFIVTSNTLGFPVIQEPIQWVFPTFLSPSNFNTFYNLNFNDPLVSGGKTYSYQNYSVTLTPTIAGNPSQVLTCQYGATQPTCSVSTISFSYVPMLLQFTVNVTSTFYPSTVVQIATSTIFFIETVQFNTEFPFVADSIVSPLTVTFNTSKSLATSGFTYECQGFGVRTPVVRSVTDNIFTCTFNTRGAEEDLAVQLFVSNAPYAFQLSASDSIINLRVLGFLPQFSLLSESISLVVKRNLSNTYTVPTKYRNNNYRISTSVNGNSQSFICSAASSEFSCSKTAIIPSPNIEQFKIPFNLEMQNAALSWDLLTRVYYDLLGYTKNSISINPLAALRNTNIDITLTFPSTTLRTDIEDPFFYFCKYNNSVNWPSTASTSTSISCNIRYNDHGNNTLLLAAFFRVPTITGNSNIDLITNEQATQLFYYLSTGSFSFISGQQKFFYTQTPSQVTTVLTTFIPTHLIGNIKCKLVSESTFFDTSLISTTSNGQLNDYRFNCSVQTTTNGKVNLQMWYVEPNSQFVISSNTLELIFVTKIGLSQLVPPAATVNFTTSFEIYSNLPNADYGNANYSCKFGANATVYTIISNATVDLPTGRIYCRVLWTEIQQIYLSIFMQTNGVELDLMPEDILVNVLTFNFLTPNHGITLGNQNTSILQYTTQNQTNITFSDPSLYMKYVFRCTPTGSSLNCFTPTIPNNLANFPIFSSKPVQFTLNNRSLDTPYILYENQIINDYNPKVLYKQDASYTFNFTVTLSKAFNITEGSLYVVFQSLTSSRTAHIVPITKNILTFQISIAPVIKLAESTTYFELFYQNPQSLQINQMISLTPQTPLILILPRDISFTSTSTNPLLYTGVSNVIRISADFGSAPYSINNIYKPNFKCKQSGNSFFSRTDPLATWDFNCHLNSTTPGIQTIELWYVAPDAYGPNNGAGSFLVSTNVLTVVFVNRIVLTQITPFASILTTTNVTMNTNLTSNIATNPYISSSLELLCSFGGTATRTLATYSNGLMTCSIDKIGTNAQTGNVTMFIRYRNPIVYELQLTDDARSAKFFFINQATMTNLSPFIANQVVNQNTLLTISVNTPIITVQSLFCAMNATTGIIYTPITLVNSLTLSCTISKSSFTSNFEDVVISLFMNVSSSSKINLSLNTIVFSFIKQPVSWSTRNTNSGSLSLNGITVPTTNPFTFAMTSGTFPSFTQGSLSCTYTKGLSPSCTLNPTTRSNYLYNPTTITFALNATNPAISQSTLILVDNINFYQETVFQHVKPHVVSYSQRLFAPLRLIFNMGKRLHSSFVYRCTIAQGGTSITRTALLDTSSAELQPSTDPESHITCTFNTFGSSNSFYNITLQFNSTNGFLPVSTSTASIRVMNPSSLDFISGPSTGGTEISLKNFPSTLPSLYTNYTYSMALYDRGTYRPLTSCTMGASYICNTPDITSLFRSWSEFTKNLRIDFLINNVFALSLSPSFTFYRSLNFTSISPSRFLISNTEYTLVLTTNQTIQFLNTKISIRFTNVGERFTECLVTGLNQITCTKVKPTRTYSPFNLEISLNDVTYFPTGLNVEVTVSISPITVNTTSLSMTSQTPIMIGVGTIINSQDIFVRLYDESLELTVSAIYSSDGTASIIAIIPPFYDRNLLFPRRLKMRISTDGRSTWSPESTFSLVIQPFPTVSLLPNVIPTGIRTTLFLTGIPSNIYVPPSSTLLFTLQGSSSMNLTCLAPYTSCTMPNNPTVNTYTLVIRIIGAVNQILYFNTVTITRYDETFLTSSNPFPRVLVRGSKLPITFSGSFSSYTGSQFKAFISYSTPGLLATITTPARITNNELIVDTIPNIPTASSVSVGFSIDGGYYFRPQSFNLSVTNDFTVTAVNNPVNVRFNQFFSFVPSNVTVLGTGFIDSRPNLRMTLNNSVFERNITNLITNLQIQSTTMSFLFPTIAQLNVPYQLLYPLILTYGLSLNGLDYRYFTVTFAETYPIPTFTSIFPIVSNNKDFTLTAYGVNLDLAAFCSFYDQSNTTIGSELAQTIPFTSTQQNAINCPVPRFITNPKRVIVFLKNKEGQQTFSSYNLNFYEIPVATKIVPSTGPTYGFTVTVSGLNFIKTADLQNIYCRFSLTPCERECTFISNTTIICSVSTVGMPPGSHQLFLGYNNIDWHGTNVNVTLTECEPGYGAPNFATTCQLCPPGTYKPTIGSYLCFKCEKDTYSQFSGSISCDKCPSNTTTGITVGATSLRDCVCSPGYYFNLDPNPAQKCVLCPVGGDCNRTNTTIPLAKPGYWYDETDWTSFQICNPSLSCPGGSFTNCTTGYSGPRCGYCSKGYFREKKFCRKCEEASSAWLRLLGIALAILLVTAFFFGFSATKVSHICGVAIAFSFWQVLSMFAKFDIIWPSTINGALTGASISNFNTDFLSPSCIFPDLNYMTLWFLQMLLPVYFFVSFCLLYGFLLVRSGVASLIGKVWQPKYWNPIVDLDSDSEEEELNPEEKKKSKLKKFGEKVLKILKEIGVWLRNFSVWFLTSKSSIYELRKIFNKIVNAYFAFLSFSFIFIMTTASEIFVCTRQSNGTLTLNSSPDLLCFNGIWWLMFPLTILWYLIFGVGSAIYFIYIYFRFEKLRKDSGFNERNKFMLSRFKRKYYFWEAVVTLRKTVLSVLYIFLSPMLVIVSGVFLLFVAFLIHIHFVPFKRKFHNIMDYFVILTTLATLFFGLLFYVNKWPDIDSKGYSGLKVFAEWVAFIVLVLSSLIVVCMIIWDITTRRNQDRRKKKRKMRKLMQEKAEDEKMKVVILNLYDREQDEIYMGEDMPWDKDYDFKPVSFHSESSSSGEDNSLTMNDIFADIFSMKRAQRKIDKFKQTGFKKFIQKTFKKNKVTEEDIQADLEFEKKNQEKLKEMSQPKQEKDSTNTTPEINPDNGEVIIKKERVSKVVNLRLKNNE